jgi:hypothetical protein
MESLPVDTVVFACGSKPYAPLYEELTGKVNTLIRVGDCIKPRSVLEAMLEGADAGLTI